MSAGREAQRAVAAFEAAQLVRELETVEEAWNERLQAHSRKAADLGMTSPFEGLTVAQFFAKRDSSLSPEQNAMRREMRRSVATPDFRRPLVLEPTEPDIE